MGLAIPKVSGLSHPGGYEMCRGGRVEVNVEEREEREERWEEERESMETLIQTSRRVTERVDETIRGGERR
jgi:hypothetical protein